MKIPQLFDAEEVEFEFQQPVDQVVEKLAARVLSPGQSATGSSQYSVESMIGGVSKESAFIYRFVPRSRNSFRPTFYGSFTQEGATTRLVGEIRLNKVIGKFIIFWCVIVGFIVLSTLVTVLRNPAASWGSLVYVVLMFIACMAFFRWMISKSKPDVEWLKNEIVRGATAID